MFERRLRPHDDAAELEALEIGVEPNPAERDDDTYMRERRDFGVEVRQAVGDLFRRRLVAWRCATDGGGDVCAGQREAIVGILRRGNVRETGAMEGGHQEVAGAAGTVAGEHAARAIGAVRRRGQADQQHACVRITEAWYGLAPVALIAERAPLHARDLGTIRPQPRTFLAGNNRLANLREGPAEARQYRCVPTYATYPAHPTYQTRQAFCRTIGRPALHENAFANSGTFETTPLTR